MLNKKSRYFIISLVLIEMISLFFTMKSFSNKTIDEVTETYEVNKKHFSLFIENEESTNYVEYTSSNIFPIGYVLNNDKSSCVGTNGQKLEGILSSSENGVTVTSNKTAYCYLYFDRPSLYELCGGHEGIDECSKDKDLGIVKTMWNSTLEEDGYRYVGINPDNYICFGTTDQEECKTNTDKYMYRIIGVFEDEEGRQHLKLIKKEALNTTYAWNADYQTDVDWDESDLYKGINGSYFLTNTNYEYMQDSIWTDKIAEWNYTATNTKTYENYNSTNGTPYGPYYYYNTVKTVYLHEMNRSSKTSQTCYYNASTTADCSVGEWKYAADADWDKSVVPKVKISLMYASDYLLSLGSSALEYAINSKYSTLKTGWMHISNNDSGAPSTYEWTSSRYGANSGGWYGAWYVTSDGYVSYWRVNGTFSVRPVFYLEADTKIDKGTGTSSDPYTIKPAKVEEQTDTEKLIENVSSDVLWKSTLEDDGYRYVGTDPNNYVCFGYDNVEEDCDFTKTANTDLYAYRIIGIFEDSEGTPHIKLIKKEALNSTYAWNADYQNDVDWDASDLYKGLNGSYFLTNTNYEYMQDSTWTDKIAEWNYTATNTKTYENYNSTNGTPCGPNYYYNTVKTVYLHEMNRSSKTSQTCYYSSSTTADCSVGDWKYATDADWDKSVVPKVKISLMYASDYLLSLGSSALDYKIDSQYSTLKTGWMNISKNDNGAPSAYEWTSSRYGDDYGDYGAWYVYSTGIVGYYYVVDANSVRPVFYLTSEVELSGEGTSTSPYIIK